MSSKLSVAQFALELGYAAGTGATKAAAAVTASGNIQAKTGVAGVPVPGAGLRSALARHGGAARRSSAADDAQLPAVADKMAADLLRAGMKLLSGDH